MRREANGELPSRRAVLWGGAFRPFFLGVGLYGSLSSLLWVAMLSGQIPAPHWLGPTWWHAHEMLFGVVAAAISGFLLTSVPVWTGSAPLAPGRLAALVALWGAGRLAMLAAGVLPAALVAVVDVSYLPVLVALLARPLIGGGRAHNWGFVPILLALAAVNLAIHAAANGFGWGVDRIALRLAVDLVIVLIVILGGRIIPAFTQNAFRRAGIDAVVRSSPWNDGLAIASVVIVLVANVFLPHSFWSGCAALLAALAVGCRMSGWQTLRTGGDPLLWSLHVGYSWVVVGLVLVAIGDLTHSIPQTAGLHALTAGSMGSMILAVVTRVGLGHTGRPLVLPRGAVVAYGLVTAGALVRVLGPIGFPAAPLPALVIGGLLWSAAFGIFAALYWPILTRPRVDGKPG